MAPKPDDPPGDYFVPHFGYDHDIVDSLKHLNDQEKVFGTMTLPKDSFVQLKTESKREPLLSWSPSTKASPYPVDYAVPNFGADREVTDSLKYASESEARLNHKWELEVDPDTDKFKVPTPHTNWEGRMD